MALPTLKVGDVVQATCVITDRDDTGNTYIHAVPGDFGTVLSEDFDPEWPVIRWGVSGNGGVCNTAPDTFAIYTGKVVCVVD